MVSFHGAPKSLAPPLVVAPLEPPLVVAPLEPPLELLGARIAFRGLDQQTRTSLTDPGQEDITTPAAAWNSCCCCTVRS